MVIKLLKKAFWWLLMRGWIPDIILRWKIRSGLKELADTIQQESKDYSIRGGLESEFAAEIRKAPIAVCQEEANEQHYEVPAEFFRIVLGPKLKYSSCLFPGPETTLAEAEINMLELYISRCGVKDGMTILDLGCGWGSVALHMAEKFKMSRVVALSNSKEQKAYIDGVARDKMLTNLVVHTGDVSVFDNNDFHQAFDRIISIEMFEHMKNYETLLAKVSTWLKADGKLFVHIFTHTWKPYHFEKDWMARTFFTGGTMPSHSLLLNFQKDLLIEQHWGVSGTHYARTLEAWLDRMDANLDTVLPILKQTYGKSWRRWLLSWRMFFIVCSETFGMDQGSKWAVSHYLFKKR